MSWPISLPLFFPTYLPITHPPNPLDCRRSCIALSPPHLQCLLSLYLNHLPFVAPTLLNCRLSCTALSCRTRPTWSSLLLHRLTAIAFAPLDRCPSCITSHSHTRHAWSLSLLYCSTPTPTPLAHRPIIPTLVDDDLIVVKEACCLCIFTSVIVLPLFTEVDKFLNFAGYNTGENQGLKCNNSNSNSSTRIRYKDKDYII